MKLNLAVRCVLQNLVDKLPSGLLAFSASRGYLQPSLTGVAGVPRQLADKAKDAVSGFGSGGGGGGAVSPQLCISCITTWTFAPEHLYWLIGHYYCDAWQSPRSIGSEEVMNVVPWVMQVGQNLQSKAGDIKDKVRLYCVKQPVMSSVEATVGVFKAYRLATLLFEACIDAHRFAPCCAMHALCVLGCVPAGPILELFCAQAAQFPGASTAEGKGNAAGGPSEVRLC